MKMGEEENNNNLYFGFDAYSKTISDILSESLNDNKKSLTIGIFGEWGSGKSKLLAEIKDSFKDDDKIIPIWFNAWRFEKEEHIIIPMLKSAFYEIANNKTFLDNANENSIKVVKSLSSFIYSTVKGLINSVSYKDPSGASFNSKEFFKEIDSIPQNINNIYNDDTFKYESMYYNFHESLESITKDVKLLFLIDDLDRCLPENSLKVLESIKLFLDTSGCAFVLALDDGVVEKGVAHHYREYDFENNKDTNENIAPPISGSEYLEKMVNIPFKLPKLMIDDIEQFLKEYFLDKEYSKNKEISKHTIKKEILDIFTKSIPPVPRKLIRVADLFKTKRQLASELSLNLDDKILAKFVILELLAPEIYRYGVGEFDGFYHRLYIWKDECGHLFNIEEIKNNIEESSKPKQQSILTIGIESLNLDIKNSIAEHEISKHYKLLGLLENLRNKR
jgi:predicted KAP-like P-loop ATPase